MKHIIYSILLSLGWLLIPFGSVFAEEIENSMTLVTPNPTSETVELWEYLKSVPNQNKILSGIWIEGNGLQEIFDNSNKYAAILGADMWCWHPYGSTPCNNEQQIIINNCVNHANNGGIIQINWHWGNPFAATFNGLNAWTDTSGELSAAQWNNLVTPGTSEHNTILADIDRHANDILKQLEYSDGTPIPIIFRPLHEIDGTWFWWSNHDDPSKTIALWNIVYDRLTNHHNLRNLIWVWNNSETAKNAQDSGQFYPGDNKVDMLAVDVYHVDYQDSGIRDESWNGGIDLSYTDFYNILEGISPNKPKALGECDALPNPDKIQNGDGNFDVPWVYALAWWTPGDGSRNTCFTSPCHPPEWIDYTYNHDLYITLDEISMNGINPGNTECPSDLTVFEYQSSNAQLQAANTVTCSATISVNADIECKAGTLVTLTEGFHAKAGSDFHAFIDECTPTDSECEVLTNASFESNTNSWTPHSCSASFSGGNANISGIEPVANFWNAVFRQENVSLQQGKEYTISIRAKSVDGGGNRPVTLKVTNPTNNIGYNHNEQSIQLLTSMETFTLPSFIMPESINNAYMELMVGHNTTDIQVEFISLKESGDCDTPPPPPGGDCQLLTNTGFDSAFAPWAASGCVPTIESGGTLRMEITTVDAGNAMVAGFEQTGLTLEQGKNYTLTFDARSGNRSIVARINNTTTQTFNLSSNMTTYTLNYSHQGSTTNFGKVEFFLGTSGAWVYLDNIELNGPCNNKEETTLAPNIELYPNPATDNIRVEYELPQSTSANILVFDAFGKVVKSITNTELQAGHQTLNMDISDLASGMYFYTLQANEWKATKKFIIVK